MPAQIIRPQNIGKHILERGGTCTPTVDGNMIYRLGTARASAQLICSLTGQYQLEVYIDVESKQAETPDHVAKLWSWWLVRYRTTHQEPG
jgi:hypothetical protein